MLPDLEPPNSPSPPKADLTKLTADAEALADLLRSEAWATFILPYLGEAALNAKAGAMLLEKLDERDVLDRRAVHRAMTAMRTGLEDQLQGMIAVLGQANHLSLKLLDVRTKPAAPMTTNLPQESGFFDPFADNPKPTATP
jgi:hypothetical protein